jgi:hypothetical protein
MKRMHLSFIGVFTLILISKMSFAQRLGIKPIIGYTYNGVGASYFGRNTLVFTESNQFNPMLTGGLHLSYQLLPKYSVEMGIQNIATSINYRIYNVNNGETIGENRVAIGNTYYHIGFSKIIKELNQNHKIKGTVGVTFYTLNRLNLRSTREFNYWADTSIVMSSGYVGDFILNGFNNISWGMMGGIGDEIYIKGKPVGEIRFTARYNFRPVMGAFSTIKHENNLHTNEYIANRLTFETSVLINLSSLLVMKRIE